MGNVLEERLSTLLTKIFLYQLYSMGGNINSVNVFFLKCTTATETLVMQRTTFLCLYLVLLLCNAVASEKKWQPHPSQLTIL